MRRILNAARLALILLLVIPAAVSAQAPPAAAPVPYIVTPGLAIGQWSLDGKVSEFIWVMGSSQITDVAVSGTDPMFRQTLWEKSWQSPRIFIVFPPTSSTVLAVGTAEAGARTIDRVGVGSTEQQLTAVYQDPQAVFEMPLRTRTLIWDARGIAFEYAYAPATGQWDTRAGRVFVFRPGQARSIWRLP